MQLLQTWDYYYDKFTTWIMHAGMPLVHIYHLISTNVFLNTAAEDAKGLEKIGNILLAPTQYLLAGNKAKIERSLSLNVSEEKGVLTYRLEQRFDYTDRWLWSKTAGSLIALPFSLLLGTTIKAISYAFEPTRMRHKGILSAMRSDSRIKSNKAYYESIGIHIKPIEEAEWIPASLHQRRPGDENVLQKDKEALKEVVTLLTQNGIPYWLDCGTCLGAYRYGGVIPWDFDIDISILAPDFDNALIALRMLDPEKYCVQDWSSRDKPKTYLKVYVKETGLLIDIYHFAINPEQKTVHSILSNEGSIFLTESWRVRERRFIMDTPYEYIFPLKKAHFDGIVVFVPNQIEKYLKQRYGENIGPAKVFNPVTNRYEKDLKHPYWQQPFAH